MTWIPNSPTEIGAVITAVSGLLASWRTKAPVRLFHRLRRLIDNEIELSRCHDRIEDLVSRIVVLEDNAKTLESTVLWLRGEVDHLLDDLTEGRGLPDSGAGSESASARAIRVTATKPLKTSTSPSMPLSRARRKPSPGSGKSAPSSTSTPTQ